MLSGNMTHKLLCKTPAFSLSNSATYAGWSIKAAAASAAVVAPDPGMDNGYLKTNPCNVKKEFGDVSDKKHSVKNLAFSIFCYLSLLAHGNLVDWTASPEQLEQEIWLTAINDFFKTVS